MKYDLRPKLLPTLVLPKGLPENFGEFWAVNYFEDKEEFVKVAIEQVEKMKIRDILKEENLKEKVIQIIP